MKGTAHIWALPYLETITSGGVAFPDWNAFEDAFKKRFAPLDSSQTLWDMLKSLKQCRGLVAEYIAKFDQYSTLTGWSDANHRQGSMMVLTLEDHVKDLFALSERPKGTYQETHSLASDINQCIRQRDAEKSGKLYMADNNSGGGKGSRDPNAMEIDTSKQDKGKEKKTQFTYL